jgi:hypothetical protein
MVHGIKPPILPPNRREVTAMPPFCRTDIDSRDFKMHTDLITSSGL